MNKNSKEWNAAPLWVRYGLYGIRYRGQAIKYKRGTQIIGFLGFLLGFANPLFYALLLMFGSAYWYSDAIRWVDDAGLW
jgi:hypothetical protein